MNKKEANLYYNKLGGRKGLAERALEIAKQMVECDSYKRAIAGAGQLKVIAEICQKADDYWGEMVNRGESPETFYAYHPKAIAPTLDSEGHLAREHWENEKKAGIK